MAFEFKLPDIGEGVIEGEIVKWLVKPGDQVVEDQPMVEVMTDKATVVIPSPTAGTILECRGDEGDIAKVHEVLVVIEDGGNGAPVEAAAPSVPTDAAPAPSKAAPAPSSARVLAAPATRRLARELGVDLGQIEGTGPGGRVMAADVRGQVERHRSATTIIDVPPVQAPPAPVAAPAAVDQRIEVRGMRRAIWDTMTRSKAHAAHFTFVEECDCSQIVDIRTRFNQHLDTGEPKLTFLPLIIKAVVSGLRKFPELNGHVEEDGKSFIQRADHHLGIAVATERGLMVPVIRHASRMSIVQLAAEIRRLGELGRTGRITPADLGGSTFTITSLGKEGGIFATPIINHPEVAIMGVHKMVKRVVVDENDEMVIRPMMNLSLSFDHRLIDGHIGAAFTYHVIKMLQSPERMFMEMV